MRSSTGLSTVWKRSDAADAKSGRARLCLAEAAAPKMDYSGGAKSA